MELTEQGLLATYSGIQRGQPQRTDPRAMEILYQLGELFLEAVPTIILVFLFYLFLRATFFKPIERVLAERSARVDGARAEAAATQASAQEKINAYNEAVRKAQGELYAEQEKEHQILLDERAMLIRAKRTAAQERIRAAKERIASELAAARADIEKQTSTLAGEVVRSVLERSTGPQSGVRR